MNYLLLILLGINRQVRDSKKLNLEFVLEFLEEVNAFSIPRFIFIQQKVLNNKYDKEDKDLMIKASNNYVEIISKINIILDNISQKWPEFKNIKLKGI